MYLRRIPSQLAKEGVKSAIMQKHSLLFKLFIYAVERTQSFVCSFEKVLSATTYWRKSICEPPASHPGCHKKNVAMGSFPSLSEHTSRAKIDSNNRPKEPVMSMFSCWTS